MAISYTVTEAGAHLGDVVDQAQQSNEIVEITRDGHVAAVVISARQHAYYRRLEDARDLAEAERVRIPGAAPIPHAEVAARFGLAPDGRRLVNPRREVVWPPGAMDQLAALARRFPEAPAAIVPAVYELADNPRPAGSTCCGASAYRRLLLGYFRVLYCVGEDPPLIEVLLVGHCDTAR